MNPSDYSYVKTHTITGSADGALSDYQVRFVVHSGTGTDDGQDVYLNGHSLSWPNDIRFTDANNNTYPYWIESYDADSATIWVRVANIPAYPETMPVNLYYGKAGDTGASNGAATFSFFDGFDGTQLDTSKWTVSGGTATVSNGILTVPNGVKVISNAQFGYNTVIIRAKMPPTQQNRIGFNDLNGANGALWWYGAYSKNSWAAMTYVDANPYGNTGFSLDGTSYHEWEIRRISQNMISWAYDGNQITTTSIHVPTGMTNIEFHAAYSCPNLYIDAVAIRSYTTGEPTQGTWGAETATPHSNSLFCLSSLAMPLMVMGVMAFGTYVARGRNKKQ